MLQLSNFNLSKRLLPHGASKVSENFIFKKKRSLRESIIWSKSFLILFFKIRVLLKLDMNLCFQLVLFFPLSHPQSLDECLLHAMPWTDGQEPWRSENTNPFLKGLSPLWNIHRQRENATMTEYCCNWKMGKGQWGHWRKMILRNERSFHKPGGGPKARNATCHAPSSFLSTLSNCSWIQELDPVLWNLPW